MFGPLGFYELVFILGIAFLLLGPRQLSVLSSNMGRTLREFYKATADVRRQINAERASLEEEIRREQQPIQEAVDEIKKIDRVIRKETGGEWSRRNVLGQNEPTPQVKPQALPKTMSATTQSESTTPATTTDSTPDAQAPDTSEDSAPRTPTLRTPAGATPRGALPSEEPGVEGSMSATTGEGVDSADPTEGEAPPEAAP